MNKEVYIVAAVRTPIGSFGGSLKSFSATELGAFAIKGAISKINIDADSIDEVYMGSVIQAGLGQAPARQAAKFASLSDSVKCTTINKVCASGMKSIAIAAAQIRLGDAEVVIAGGMESMSNVPFYNTHQRWGHKYGHLQIEDGLAKDGLVDVYDQIAMGSFADLCANEYQISRDAQDQFAAESYQKAQKAISAGWFQNEIIPITIQDKKGNTTIIDKDEEPYNVTFDKIPTLKPAFNKEGTVTAANASTMNDGAAALILMSKEKMEALRLQPIAKIVSYADAEQAPKWFTTAPSKALPIALEKCNLTIDDIDLFELNEAFSVVGLVNAQILNIPKEKINIHGGAVALGHPLGCSGARIMVTLIHALKTQNKSIGAGSICNGGGGASAMVIERC
jgi:acetyl-CoA C-acetyltransferase